MSAPASEDLREVERLLIVATEQSDTMTVAALGDEIGKGHGDVEGMLSVLREHGKAFEDAPGLWRGPYASEIEAAASGEPEPLTVSVEHPEQLDEADGPISSVGGARLAAEVGAGVRLGTLAGFEPTVRMTAAIAGALGPEALGALVKAGIDEAVKEGVVFRMEVSG